MSLSAVFIRRPVGTTLLTIGLALAGLVAFFKLPVAPLPQVDYPTIVVSASMAGASPETMATSVATPLERHLGVIADVTEMTSWSTVGSTRITLQFALSRDIDGAAREVQAAINAARADLPASLRSNPTYRKVNPADAPILILSLTSDLRTRGQMHDAASMVLVPALSQIPGVGQVTIGGGAARAVRIEIDPAPLFHHGIGLEDVRAAIAAANAHSPKGAIEDGSRRWQLYANDQAMTPDDYKPLVIAYRNGAPVRLGDVAKIEEGQESRRNIGLSNGKPAVLVVLHRQPGGNIIEAVDRVSEILPRLRAALPSDIDLAVALDRSTTIRASLHEVEITLVIAVALVILVVFLFLRDARTALIPSVAVPVSLLGTFGAMHLLGYSLNTPSLMALTIAAGFVVDDAIVVVENVMRHVEAGMGRIEAALRGAREIAFTVVSMSLSLIAVFVPILLMPGLIGRMFREFAVVLSVAILISMIVSLTTTPMMCAYLATKRPEPRGSGWREASDRLFAAMLRVYARSLAWSLRRPALVLVALLLTVALNIHLFMVIPKGLMPQQDTGRLVGGIRGDQSASFELMQGKLAEFIRILGDDPAVANVTGFTGGGRSNSGYVFVALKPLAERDAAAAEIVARLRPKLAQVAGARLYLRAVQDIRVGGRESFAQYQYTLQADDLAQLYEWGPRIAAALEQLPQLIDVNSDQQQGGLETRLVIDRATAARLGVTPRQINNALYNAFGERVVSTIYTTRYQYRVVMEASPRYWETPDTLNKIFISTAGGISGTQATNALAGTLATVGNGTTAGTGSADSQPDAAQAVRNRATNAIANGGRGGVSTGTAVSTAPERMVPLSAIARFETGNAPLAVNHQGLFAATTVSFNVKPGVSLGEATRAIDEAMLRIGVPATIVATFEGTARAFQSSLKTQPLLILVALVTVYIVLGVLYESLVHPITILSTLPSAGVGAVLALLLFSIEFSVIAMIGVILLIGIVKKNAIMMIDFALAAERNQGFGSREAIYRAALLRFRPIMMTTAAAVLGAVPLAIGFGEGSELRRPLGIAIVSGLLVSQVLTLYTTPVVYLYLDRWRLRMRRGRLGTSRGAEHAAD
ncbi:MAG: efflux RND transporter permease subunit [Alphaproteobacteria bacterium]